MNTIKRTIIKFMSGHQNINASIFIVAALIFTIGCKTDHHYIDDRKVQKIKIAYLPKGINPDMAISNCNDVLRYSALLQDTTITNREFISEFISQINDLEESSDSTNFDFRINCLVFLKEGQYRQICFGEDHLIVLDKVLMKDNRKLFLLIDDALY